MTDTPSRWKPVEPSTPSPAPVAPLTPSVATPAPQRDWVPVGSLRGPEGPPGPPGPAPSGIPGVELSFGFATPAVTWVLPHNLDGSVNVEVFDQNNETLDVNVEYPDPNTAVVYFYYPTAGTARVFR